MSSVKVVVRLRPFNKREIENNSARIVNMTGQQTVIEGGPSNKQNSFTFDSSYDSFDSSHPNYVNQEQVYNDSGKELVDHAFSGYNCCLFAYGQTGSGKSYSMMGYGDNKGIIPRLCDDLFQRIAANQDPELTFTLEVSYMEIYNERVRDLLNPNNKGNLKVREHPSLGPYVEDLSKLIVTSYADIERLMDEGNQTRTVAATNMNETSSRSHAVFTMVFTQKRLDSMTKLTTDKVSKISLVDLAGSERADSTGATGARLKEGANINKSLTTLGLVISALADASSADKKKGKKATDFVPYRDSVLTWLLKDNLGGNSKTTMLAALSPADINYDETLSTLRYADRAKRIVNKAVVNEDANARLIRELKEEVARLREQLLMHGFTVGPDGSVIGGAGLKRNGDDSSLIDELTASEKLFAELNEGVADKIRRTQEIASDREKFFEETGVAIKEGAKGAIGIRSPAKTPHLLNLNEDPMMNECLIYYIQEGETLVGRAPQDPEDEANENDAENSHPHIDIQLSGANVVERHCIIESVNGVVSLVPQSEEAATFVNGQRVTERRALQHLDRVVFGTSHFFSFKDLEGARRKRLADAASSEEGPMSPTKGILMEGDLVTESPSMPSMDWHSAQKELADSQALQASQDKKKAEEMEERVKMLESQIQLEREERLRLQDQSNADAAAAAQAAAAAAAAQAAAAAAAEKAAADAAAADKAAAAAAAADKAALDAKAALAAESEANEKAAAAANEHQKMLARRVASKWKQFRRASLKDQLFETAVLLKEANVISKELHKGVTFQFCVLRDTPFSPSAASSHERHSQQRDVRASVAVQVTDNRHHTTSIWPLDKFLHRRAQMPEILNLPPGQAGHHEEVAEKDDPFYEATPWFRYLGRAYVYLVPSAVLARQSHAVTTPLVSENAETRATLHVTVNASAEASSDAIPLHFGGQGNEAVHVCVHVDQLQGMEEINYTHVVCQMRLNVADAEIVTTQPIRMRGADVEVGLSKTFAVTGAEGKQLRDVAVAVDVFGYFEERGRSASRIHAFHRGVPHHTTTAPQLAGNPAIPQRPAAPMTATPAAPVIVRSQSRAIAEQPKQEEAYDILGWFEISELAASGDYLPVPVHVDETPKGPAAQVFQLKHGLQRRITITLEHSSAKDVAFRGISGVTAGDVRSTVRKGEAPPANVPLHIIPSQSGVADFTEGGRLRVEVAWDSSLHNTPLLNGVTRPDELIAVTIACSVDVDGCSRPVVIQKSLVLRISAREASLAPSRSLGDWFSGKPKTRVASKVTGIFKLSVWSEAVARHKREAMDTSGQYVRGEESLEVRRPRSVSLIGESQRHAEKMWRVAEVEHTRQFLEAKQVEASKATEGDEEKQKLLMEKVAALALTRGIEARATAEVAARAADGANGVAGTKGIRNASVQEIVDYDRPSCSGELNFLAHTEDKKWIRKFVVIRRPYLCIYDHEDDPVERKIINLTNAKVTYNDDQAQLLLRPNTFSLFTRNGGYLFQDVEGKKVQDWLYAIDPLAAGMMRSRSGTIRMR